MNKIINQIMNDLTGVLGKAQLEVVEKVLTKYIKEESESVNKNTDLLQAFIAAKRVEGCSEKSLVYYAHDNKKHA